MKKKKKCYQEPPVRICISKNLLPDSTSFTRSWSRGQKIKKVNVCHFIFVPISESFEIVRSIHYCNHVVGYALTPILLQLKKID